MEGADALCFRRAGEADRDGCVRLVRQAFREDSLFVAAAGGREEGRDLLLELLTRVWLESQTAFAAEREGKLIGLAVLGREEDAAVSLRSCVKLGAGRVLGTCGAGNLLAFLRCSGRFNRSGSREPGPRWYLTLLAVAPEEQGRGVGSAIVRDCVLPFLRQQGCRTLCLNTNEEKNRRFYLKNRFEETDAAFAEIGGRRVCNWSFRKRNF